MKDKCQVRLLNGRWHLLNKHGKDILNKHYHSYSEALLAARCYAMESGDELAIYDENDRLVERIRLNYGIGE